MTTETSEETPRVACPACGEITLAHETITDRCWAPATRYACQSTDCDYEHTIEHP